MTIDLEKEGVIGSNEQPEGELPEEMLDQQFLDSPIGRVMQALAGLEMAAKSFDARLSQMEQYVTYLLSKDPHVGPKIAAIAKAGSEQSGEVDGQHTK